MRYCLALMLLTAILFKQINTLMIPLPCNGDEEKACNQASGNRTSTGCSKVHMMWCSVTCTYSDGNKKVNSPDGQLCCNIGFIATGTCRDGVCRTGEM